MRIGSVVRTRSVQNHFRNQEVRGRVGFKAPSGKLFVFVFLGLEEEEGGVSLDPDSVLEELGWTPPESEEDTFDGTATELERCGITNPKLRRPCVEPEGHTDAHRTEDGGYWPNNEPLRKAVRTLLLRTHQLAEGIGIGADRLLVKAIEKVVKDDELLEVHLREMLEKSQRRGTPRSV